MTERELVTLAVSEPLLAVAGRPRARAEEAADLLMVPFGEPGAEELAAKGAVGGSSGSELEESARMCRWEEAREEGCDMMDDARRVLSGCGGRKDGERWDEKTKLKMKRKRERERR